ncbi:hypothetical protein ACLB2K_022480 [Fragaria x ananassa]
MDSLGWESSRGHCWSLLRWRRAVTGAGGWRTDGQADVRTALQVRTSALLSTVRRQRRLFFLPEDSRGLRDGVDMKKKVRQTRIGALGNNLTENFKTDQGWLETCSRQVHQQGEAQYQGLLSYGKKKRHRRHRTVENEGRDSQVQTSAPFSGTDFYRFSTIPAPATSSLLPGVIPDLPRRCWNEKEGRRDRNQRSTMIGREGLSEIVAQTSDRSLRPSSSFQHRRGRSGITPGRRNCVPGAGTVEKR